MTSHTHFSSALEELLLASPSDRSDAAAIRPTLMALVRDAVEATLSVATITERLRGDLADLSRLSNARPVTEGKLIEQAVRVIAGCNPRMTLLPSTPLPLLPAAMELVKRNPVELLSGVSFDSSTSTASTYLPDLVALDRTAGIVHLIDVKRSLGHYNAARVDELKLRMLAAGLVVPDLVWRRHWREPVKDVQIAIVDASGRSSPMGEGVVPVAQLDDLLGVTGAAAAIAEVQLLFDALVQANFDTARQALAERPVRSERALKRDDRNNGSNGSENPVASEAVVPANGNTVADDDRRGPDRPGIEVSRPGAFRVGFARLAAG